MRSRESASRLWILAERGGRLSLGRFSRGDLQHDFSSLPLPLSPHQRTQFDPLLAAPFARSTASSGACRAWRQYERERTAKSRKSRCRPFRQRDRRGERAVAPSLSAVVILRSQSVLIHHLLHALLLPQLIKNRAPHTLPNDPQLLQPRHSLLLQHQLPSHLPSPHSPEIPLSTSLLPPHPVSPPNSKGSPTPKCLLGSRCWRGRRRGGRGGRRRGGEGGGGEGGGREWW